MGCEVVGRRSRDNSKVLGLNKGKGDIAIGKTKERAGLRVEWILIFSVLRRDSKSISDIWSCVQERGVD